MLTFLLLTTLKNVSQYHQLKIKVAKLGLCNCFLFTCRLLDICHKPNPRNAETYLTLVFEHIDQDLACYLEQCPSPGLSEWKIKVCSLWIILENLMAQFDSNKFSVCNSQVYL